jgi:hypothetical protein
VDDQKLTVQSFIEHEDQQVIENQEEHTKVILWRDKCEVILLH